MSKRINVNPDHYKTAGRERPGRAVPHEQVRRAFAQEQAQTERWQAARKPIRPPTAAQPAAAAAKRVRRAPKPAPKPAPKKNRAAGAKTTKRTKRRR